MFNFNPFKLPSYEDFKTDVSKFWNDVAKFYKDWYSDIEKNLKK